MVDVLAFALRFVLATVFAVAAIAKFRDREGTAEALQGFGVPTTFIPQATYLLPAAEASAVLLLLTPPTYVLGAWLTLGLLVTFTSAIAVNLAQGNRVACRCFGEMSAKPIGPRTIARNFGLSAIALLVALAAPSTWAWALHWFQALDPEDAKLSLGVAALSVVLFVEGWLLLRLKDQNESLTQRLHALETAGQPVGLEPGTEAPAFELITTDGAQLSLRELLARGKPLVLTFTDPHCGPCQTLVPQVAMWQSSLKNVFTVGIVSRGKPEDNRTHATEHGLTEVMIQKRDEVAGFYKATGTPNAVRISPDGKIESYLARGPEEITALFETLIAEHAQSLWEQATGEEIPRPYSGLPIDTEVPEMVVHDLDGDQHRLPELLADPTMLVFWGPRCGFCHQIADEMRAIEARLPRAHHLLFATSGTPEENRFFGLNSKMLFDPGFELGNHFHAQGTPAAVLLEGGKVVSGLESGTDGVLSLAERFIGVGPKKVDAPTFRPSDN